MASLNIDQGDAMLIYRALNELRACNPSSSALRQIDALESRVRNALPNFTSGELRNICLGLELILDQSPLDWQVSRFLSRIQAFLSEQDG